MRIPLQEIGHQDSAYERPNQKWVCGRLKDGNPCRLGPDGKGLCTVAAQSFCEPVKNGDRWMCTRSDILGGACERGPSPNGECACPPPEQEPCVPVRSLRAKRQRVSIAAGLFSIALLLIWLSGPMSLVRVSPGELSAAHLAIEGPPGSPNCAVCHVGAEPGFGQWVGMMWRQDEGHSLAVSQQCLTCHFSGVDEPVAISAHSSLNLAAPPDEPLRASMFGGPTSFMLALADTVHGEPQLDTSEIACATCHNEHRGANHNMNLMSDVQCQVCHSDQFESFNMGHPEFGATSAVTLGISFDHAKHKARFEEPLDCQGCHEADTAGKTMLVKSFEMTCQGCHEQRSVDHHGDAIKRNPVPFLQLPEMEFDDDIYWPMDLAVGENLTPMMALLLAGDEEAAPLVAEIFDEDNAAGDMFEWFFILEDEGEEYKKAELAMAIKRLVAELADYSSDGNEARKARLVNVFSLPEDDIAIQKLSEELASANFVMQMFQQRYLPRLEDDLSGDAVDAADDEELQAEWMASSHMGGWRVDSEEGAISYRAVAHSDRWLKTWIDALNRSSSHAMPETSSDVTMVRTRMHEELGGDFKACTRCHTSESNVNSWQALGRPAVASGFIKFNHRPHMAMLNEPGNCLTCHVPKSSGDDDDMVMPRGFLPHDKAVCGNCHEPEGVDNTCLNCHQYHFERP